MKYTSTQIAILLCVSMFSAGHVYALEDITLTPSVAYQQKILTFKQEYTAGVDVGRKAHFTTSIPTLNTTLTAVYSKFYASYKFEKSIVDGQVDIHEQLPLTSTTFYMNTPNEKTEVAREDQSLTLGYNAWKTLNVFVGYMRGITDLMPAPGCILACTVTNVAYDHQNAGLPRYEQNYTEQGPYIGASYSWVMGDSGALSVSGAYAHMSGKYEDNYQTFPASDFRYEGDTNGLSIGATWTAPLGETSGYFIDLRRQHYSMNGKDDSGNFPGSKVETEETMTGLTLGIQFYF